MARSIRMIVYLLNIYLIFLGKYLYCDESLSNQTYWESVVTINEKPWIILKNAGCKYLPICRGPVLSMGVSKKGNIYFYINHPPDLKSIIIENGKYRYLKSEEFTDPTSQRPKLIPDVYVTPIEYIGYLRINLYDYIDKKCNSMGSFMNATFKSYISIYTQEDGYEPYMVDFKQWEAMSEKDKRENYYERFNQLLNRYVLGSGYKWYSTSNYFIGIRSYYDDDTYIPDEWQPLESKNYLKSISILPTTLFKTNEGEIEGKKYIKFEPILFLIKNGYEAKYDLHFSGICGKYIIMNIINNLLIYDTENKSYYSSFIPLFPPNGFDCDIQVCINGNDIYAFGSPDKKINDNYIIIRSNINTIINCSTLNICR